MAPKARVQKRLYYKIGEACKALGIQPYVLRYWETEFPALSPSKSRSGQRVYSEKELEVIRRIKQLLYDEGYTIAGAKKKLDAELAAGTLGESATAATVNGPGVFQTVAEPRGHHHRTAAPQAAGVGLAGAGGAGAGGVGANAGGVGSGPIPVRSGALPLTAEPGDAEAAPGRAGLEAKAQPLAGRKQVPAPPGTAASSEEPERGGEPVRSRAATARPPAGPAAAAREGSSRDGTAEEGALKEGAAQVGAAQEDATQIGAAAAAVAGISGLAWPVAPTLPLVSPAGPSTSRPGAAPGAPQVAPGEGARGTAGEGAAEIAAIEARSAKEAGAPSKDRGVRSALQAVPAPATASGTAAPSDLDTTAAKQVETLRKGIQKALQEAREILALLDSRSPR
jgi:DNA-binding transcriptional MerR regulator